jgi:hypothetical protein
MQHLAVVEKVTHGATIPALLQEWYTTPTPERFLHLIPLYDDINNRRRKDPEPLNWEHIAFWSIARGEQLSLLEIDIIFQMDDVITKAKQNA